MTKDKIVFDLIEQFSIEPKQSEEIADYILDRYVEKIKVPASNEVMRFVLASLMIGGNKFINWVIDNKLEKLYAEWEKIQENK